MIVVLIFSSVLAAAWLILLSMTVKADWIDAAIVKVLDNRTKIDELRRKDAAKQKAFEEYTGIAAVVMGLFLKGNSEKEIAKLAQQSEALQHGNLKSVSVFDMPGYVLQRRFEALGRGALHKEILSKCRELYGRKYADNKAKQLIARLLSYSLVGVALSMTVGTLTALLGSVTTGIAIAGIGTVLVLVLVYALYDELTDRLNKRRAAISRQFPNVVSKLALLVTSGMILDRAWRETAESQELELYQEMRKTADEMANLMDPVSAYTNFIDRCNTKETSKLASALIQSHSKGNAEIGTLLKSMAHDAWQERRHTAKRDSEAANSKLMIPTMLLFIAILVILMVPVALNFSGLM